jgi:hypothetical protein
METLKIENLVNQINNLDESQLIELNNRYCQSCNIDSEVYHNDEEFFELFYPDAGDGLRVAQAVFYGDYNYSHDYVKFDGYGNLESLSTFEVENLCDYPAVIAEYALDNENEFNDILNFYFEEAES